MKYRQIIALPLLGLAFGGLAQAGALPLLSSINNSNTPLVTPLDIDYTFNNRGLNVSVAKNNTSGGYTLTATGAGNVNFYQNESKSATSSTSAPTSYSLRAEFDANSHFLSSGSSLTITGTLSSNLGGTGTPTGTLFSANLTDFGYDTTKAELGFKTDFTGSTAWANQAKFTGGSTGEVLYLYDQVGLATGHGSLTALTNALTAGSLAGVSGATFHGVQSIASVPLPLPVILFGTGLTALMGFARKRRNSANSI